MMLKNLTITATGPLTSWLPIIQTPSYRLVRQSANAGYEHQ